MASASSTETCTYYQCPYCPRSFSTYNHLKAHVRYEELQNGSCPVCGKTGMRCPENHIIRKVIGGDAAHARLFILVGKYSHRSAHPVSNRASDCAAADGGIRGSIPQLTPVMIRATAVSVSIKTGVLE
jgi:hypothetical protein